MTGRIWRRRRRSRWGWVRNNHHKHENNKKNNKKRMRRSWRNDIPGPSPVERLPITGMRCYGRPKPNKILP